MVQPAFRIAAALAGIACLGLTSCVEVVRFLDLTVADALVGAPPGSVSLPIRAWMTEGEITAQALSACFEPGCSPRLAIGLFRAQGRSARTIRSILDDPDRLRREIDRRRDLHIPSVPARPVVTEVAKLSEGGMPGLVISLRSGQAEASGVVFASTGSEPLRFLFAIGAGPAVVDMARRVARTTLR